MDPAAEKQALRRYFRQVLDRQGQGDELADLSRRAHRCADWLRSRPELKRIAIFAKLPGEPDLSLLHQLLPSHEFLYPLVTAPGVAQFHLVSTPATLVPGSYGIREPDPQVHPPVTLESIDVFLCPGLAFGSNGSRLGRGGGFYDRILAAARPDAPRVGVGFSSQFDDKLPMEPHDAWMTHLDSAEGIVAV